MCLFKELRTAQYSKEGKGMAASAGWPLPWAVLLTTCAQLEVATRVRVGRKAEVRKGCTVIYYSASFGLADKVGGQDNNLETLTWCFCKAGMMQAAIN